MELLALVLTAGAAMSEGKTMAPATVVFVCQHGNVKSLIASRWFDRLAAERGLSARALSRGVAPETRVPAGIADRLARDGFDVRGFEAQALAPADVEGATTVVLIGIEPPPWLKGQVETWDGIPPASEQYEASRDAMRDRIAALLSSLAERAR